MNFINRYDNRKKLFMRYLDKKFFHNSDSFTIIINFYYLGLASQSKSSNCRERVSIVFLSNIVLAFSVQISLTFYIDFFWVLFSRFLYKEFLFVLLLKLKIYFHHVCLCVYAMSYADLSFRRNLFLYETNVVAVFCKLWIHVYIVHILTII